MIHLPKIGVGVIIAKGQKILLGKRKNSHGAGTWCFPGGHLEFGEDPEDCAIREVFEETGLSITDIRRWTFTNDIFISENKHYISLFMLANYLSGVETLKEPHKFDRWDWFSWNTLPSPLFLPIQNLCKRYQALPLEMSHEMYCFHQES